MIGTEGALALVAVDPRLLGELLRRGEHHPTLSTRDDLGGVERERRGHPERARETAVEGRPMGVRGVLQQSDAPLVAERPQLIDLGRDQTADVDDHDGSREGGQCRRGGGGAERERGGVHVGEDRSAARLQNGGGGRVERVRGHDHLASIHPGGAQSDGERGGAARDGHGMRRVRGRSRRAGYRLVRGVGCSERCLEPARVWPQRESAIREYLGDRAGNLRPIAGREHDARRWHSQWISFDKTLPRHQQ